MNSIQSPIDNSIDFDFIYPSVIETKSIKWKLKVEIFVQLGHRCMNVALVVAVIVVAAFVEIPI